MDTVKKIKNFEMKKMWQWLLYLYVILPAVLLILGIAARELSMGIVFARLFHSYSLYIANPIPDAASLTGFFGAALAIWAVARTLYRRDLQDFVLCFALVVVNGIYYFFGWNYYFVQFLSFA